MRFIADDGDRFLVAFVAQRGRRLESGLSSSDNDDAEPMKGSALMLEFDDPAAMRVLFGRMAVGGVITVPLARQYWGSDFGMLVDTFSVQWMFSENVD